jgi:putative sigma-54 modulation protein
MNLHVTGHHLAVTPAIRRYLARKLERILHHFDHLIDVSVVLAVEKLEHKVEATVRVAGKEIFCRSRHNDMYAAIDDLADKLDRALVRHKEKALERRHGAARRGRRRAS